MRIRALAITALAAALAVPAAAHASGGSITYLGPDGNVWLTTPDGARQKRVTANASGSLSYYSPSTADDGTVVAAANNKFFYVLAPDGSNRSGPWLARVNSLSGSPTSAQVSPGGSTIAFGYLYQAQPDTGQWNLQPRVHFNSTSAPGSACGTPFICHTGYSDPRWIHGTPYAGMLSYTRDAIVVQGGSGVQPWLTASGETFDSFDYSRAGNQALLTTDIGGGQRRLYLWQNNGPAPAAGGVVCEVSGFGNADSAPRFSPDSTTITWHDARGVWVSPRPVSAGGRCALSPTLIAAGGRSPTGAPPRWRATRSRRSRRPRPPPTRARRPRRAPPLHPPRRRRWPTSRPRRWSRPASASC